MSTVHQSLADSALDLAWSLWRELGGSTWSSGQHDQWAVELEPLIVFTAMIAERDARLLRESVDWCVANHKFVSARQVRHVATAHEWPLTGQLERFASTVAQSTRKPWLPTIEAQPYDFAPSGMSRAPDLTRAALLQLRLRAIFGVGSRAEIVRALLADPDREWSLADIARRVAYTRRQVTTELEMLTAGGVALRFESGGTFRYTLQRADALMAWLGDTPSVHVDWAPLFRIVAGLVEIADSVTADHWRVPEAEMSRRLRELEPQFTATRLRPPTPTSATDHLDDVAKWSRALLRALATGDHERLRTLRV
jgi:hypothetical protein